MNRAQILARIEDLRNERIRRKTGGSLSAFIRQSWPIIERHSNFIDGFHIDAISEHLMAVRRNEIKNLLINIPPRHAKSTIVSVAFPAWVWTDEPWVKFLYGSHSDSLAKRDSIKCRNLVESEWYRQTYGIHWDMSDDQNEKKNFKNTEGGSRRATSVLASIIGEGGDYNIIDDPHSPRSVRSKVKREDELRWLDEEFFSRINDPKTAHKIMIMQRLDKRDASAHVLEKGDWEHLMLPARFEDARKCSTSIGWEDPRKKEGEPLWPKRFDEKGLDDYEKTIGPRQVPGQMQQRPSDATGTIFKRSYFTQFYKEIPKNLEFIGLSVDLPFDEAGTMACFNVWARKQSQFILLPYEWRDDVGFNEQLVMFKTAIATIKEKGHYLNVKWLEKKATGSSMIAVCQKEIPGIEPVNPTMSKELRAEAIVPLLAANNVWLPDPSIAPWIGEWIEEHIDFPNGLYNDRMDTTSQALMKLNSRVSFDIKPGSITGTSKFYGK